MEQLKSQIAKNPVPNHIAVIMDGNGRWAKLKGKPRVFGHKNGVTSVRQVIEG
ncbi:undecaprenyl diphosphate synthase family protein, partial [uncultured Lutibacter sp.]|uniref:undecaprenyl diphosphate synthase family protein n=1 Tax=uncultured Lutibacter sp. TaxID=437739 RepID=UPI00345DB70B